MAKHQEQRCDQIGCAFVGRRWKRRRARYHPVSCLVNDVKRCVEPSSSRPAGKQEAEKNGLVETLHANVDVRTNAHEAQDSQLASQFLPNYVADQTAAEFRDPRQRYLTLEPGFRGVDVTARTDECASGVAADVNTGFMPNA